MSNHKGKKEVPNPVYESAEYEIQFMSETGVRIATTWPARSNNPNMMRDKDFIPPTILVDA